MKTDCEHERSSCVIFSWGKAPDPGCPAGWVFDLVGQRLSESLGCRFCPGFPDGMPSCILNHNVFTSLPAVLVGLSAGGDCSLGSPSPAALGCPLLRWMWEVMYPVFFVDSLWGGL
ncbi:MAG: hypothetical protein R6U51_01965 [Anaerolineales bacterium]